MKREKHWRWQFGAAIVAAGVLAFGLALQGAPPEGKAAKRQTGTPVHVGPGIPATMDGIPSLPPMKVDYRDKGGETWHGPNATTWGEREVASWEPSDELLKAAGVGDACLLNEHCYTCNECIEYACNDFVCYESYNVCSADVGTLNNGEPCDVDADCPSPLPGACIPLAENVSGCDDGDFCNGQETCSFGDCLAGTPPDCAATDQVCDEARNACVDPCANAGDCDDGLACTIDSCNLTTEVCVHANACEANAQCVEPEPPATAPICIDGRCCEPGDPATNCSRELYTECTGDWYRWGSNITLCTDQFAECPDYSAGIASDAVITGEVGAISNLDCDDYITIGDDYKTWDHDTLAPNKQFILVDYMRFVGSVVPGAKAGARWSIEFRDSNGDFIENTFYPNGANDGGGLAIRTVDFDPDLVIPSSGIVSFTVHPNFTLDGRVNLYSTDQAQNGTNDATTMYVQRYGDATGSVRNFLGYCVGGAREGLICDRLNGNGDCGTGTCDPNVPNILAFELVGTTGVDAPMGACCDNAARAGICTLTLPWECPGYFQGEGTLCGICDGNSTNAGEPCDNNETCNGGDCLPLPACENQACCAADGTCAIAAGDCTTGTPQGFGTDCDPNCCLQPAESYIGADNCLLAQTGAPVIPVPALGDPPVTVTITGDNSGATYDDSQLVCQDGPNQFDPCDDGNGEPDHTLCGGVCIGGDTPGGPCTGDEDCTGTPNGTCDLYVCAQLCGYGFLDPDGFTRDPGWWTSFSIDACAEVRIDLCCTDIDGDVLRPAWGSIYLDCPCDGAQATIGIDPPIGAGRGTEGSARGGPFCAADNLWMTHLLEAGQYFYPIYSAPDGTGSVPPGTDFQLHITVKACPIAACCTGETCAVVNEIECADIGGNWLLGNVSCGDDANCALSPAQTDNPCCTGACCTGTEAGVVCVDLTPASQPMTLDDCAILEGNYVGGASCLDDPDPCPVCLVESEANCQESAQATVMSDDIALPDIGGLRRLDDFIADGPSVTSVCLTGSWIDSGIDCNPAVGFNRCDCACADDDQLNCITQTTDLFTVCIWEDLGTVPGYSTLPNGDGLVGCSTTSFTRGNNYGPDSGFNFDEYTVSLLLNTPLPTAVGEVYWLQVYDDTTLPLDNTCYFYWARDGMLNDEAEDPSGNDKSLEDVDGVEFEVRDIDGIDYAFCLNYPVEPPPEQALGACCLCEPLGSCEPNTMFSECAGVWKVGESCETPDLCPQVRPGNDLFADREAAVVGNNQWSNVCATHGDYDTMDPDELFGCADTAIGSDVWYEYVACGVPGGDQVMLTVSLCEGTAHDTVLSVYSNGTSTCVGTEPVDDTDLIACSDDDCPNVAFFGPSEVSFLADPGVCYTIRLGGWRDYRCDPTDPLYDPATCRADCAGGCQGLGLFNVDCGEVACLPTDAPLGDYTPVPATTGSGTKNRFATFAMAPQSVDPEPVAIRVTFTSVPGFPSAVGRTMWVQQPVAVTEASGSNLPTPLPTFWGAQLGCTPVFLDWSTYNRVDVYNDAVIPNAVFDFQAFRQSCIGQEGLEEAYSDPLTVQMSRAGDIVGDCGVTPCTAPQGVVDFVDISACVDKFRNLLAAPRKARADVINSDVSRPLPDLKVDFVDISCTVEAFRNQPCPPVGPPAVDPCTP